MNKAKINYLLDAVIGLAFLLSALSGVAFLFMGSGGYQGGRNAVFVSEFLGIARLTWSDFHEFASLMLMAGVLVHLVLHWNWIVCLTKQLIRFPQLRRAEQCEV